MPAGHPQARTLWNLLRDRSEADRRLVFEALQPRLGNQERSENQALAIEALQRFAADQHRAVELPDPPKWAQGRPSKKRYDAFRASRKNPKDWPSAQLIWNAFGRSWPAALQAAGLQPSPDISARRLTAIGPPYTTSEVLGLLDRWKREVDVSTPGAPLIESRFYEWGRARADDPRDPVKRCPTRPTVRKLLGPWPAILQRLGCLQRFQRVRRSTDRATGPYAAEATAWANSIALDSVPYSTGPERGSSSESCRYGNCHRPASELADWLLWLASSLGPQGRDLVASMAMKRWDEYRRALVHRGASNGVLISMPAAHRFVDHPEIRSWPKAKVMAGLLDYPAAVLQFSRLPYSEDAIFDAIVRGAQVTKAWPLTPARWRHYRSDELARLAKDDSRARIPSEAVIRNRLGGPGRDWRVVLAAVEHARPQVLDLNSNGTVGSPHRDQMIGRAA